MQTVLNSFLIILSLLALGALPSAQADSQRKRVSAQWAIVQTPGAAIYKVPNFDAPVLEYLEQGDKVLASRKIYKGIGGFGSFFMVKTRTGTKGFVSDVDLVPQYKVEGPGESKRDSVMPPGSENPEFEKIEDIQQNREPFYFTRYIGGTLGAVDFSEKFSGQVLHSQTRMYGLKMVGPGVLFDGPPLDFTFAFHIGAPAYYDQLDEGVTTGYLVFSDLLINLPFIEWSDTLVHYGVGLMGTYTSFRVPIRNSIIDSQELRLGAALAVGASHRIGKFALRLDAKYYYEKTKYMAYWLSVMTEY